MQTSLLPLLSQDAARPWTRVSHPLNAAAAPGDAAEAAFRRKLHHYRHVIPQLAEAGIAFRPLVWTADGRPPPAAVRTLKFAAEQAATRSGEQVTASALLGRWRHEIMVAILRRRAAMSRAVRPRPDARALWLLAGHPDLETTRAPPLDEDFADSLDEADNKETMARRRCTKVQRRGPQASDGH